MAGELFKNINSTAELSGKLFRGPVTAISSPIFSRCTAGDPPGDLDFLLTTIVIASVWSAPLQIEYWQTAPS